MRKRKWVVDLRIDVTFHLSTRSRDQALRRARLLIATAVEDLKRSSVYCEVSEDEPIDAEERYERYLSRFMVKNYSRSTR